MMLKLASKIVASYKCTSLGLEYRSMVHFTVVQSCHSVFARWFLGCPKFVLVQYIGYKSYSALLLLVWINLEIFSLHKFKL
jgi:hypothetical protein